MKTEDFADLVDRYGGDLTRWPAGLGSEAEALVRADAAARRVLDEARALDSLLAMDQTATPSGALMGRILAETTSCPDTMGDRVRGWLIGPWARGAALAAVALVGFMVGAGVLSTPDMVADSGFTADGITADDLLDVAIGGGIDLFEG